MTQPALFVAAHPDDETLMASVAIAEHLRASPAQDIHVLWLSRGESSGVLAELNGTGVSSWWGVLHDPAVEGYGELGAAAFGAARVAEATNAVRALASGYPGALTLHEAQLTPPITVSMASDAILAVCDAIDPTSAGVRLKGHTWVSQLDSHPDHVAAGQAIKDLAAADPDRFGAAVGGPRFYLLPPYWSDPDLNLVAESIDLPADSGVASRVLNAVRAYGAWSPPHTYAIGAQSVPSMFATLSATPKCVFHP